MYLFNAVVVLILLVVFLILLSSLYPHQGKQDNQQPLLRRIF